MFRMPFRGAPRRAVSATWPSCCPQNAYRLYQSPKHCNQNGLLLRHQTTSQTIQKAKLKKVRKVGLEMSIFVNYSEDAVHVVASTQSL